MSKADTPVAITAPNGSGTWKSTCYHTRNCRGIKQANPDNLREVSDDDRERYHLRECTHCQNLKTQEVLSE